MIRTFASICSGIGTQEMAFKEVFFGELKFFSEIDKKASENFRKIHGDIKNIGDFTKADGFEEVDFMFVSTPCQDFSKEGAKKGFDGMKGTLTFEWVQQLKKTKKLPKIIMFENVSSIKSKRYIDGFCEFKDELKKLGYKIFDKIINAVDHNIPQNRERLFLIGTLEDVDFEFPKKKELTKTIKNFLEKEVPKERYFDNEKVNKMMERVVTLPETFKERSPKIGIKQATKKGYIEMYLGGICDMTQFKSKTRRGRVQGNGWICPTLTTSVAGKVIIDEMFRMRNLTPYECWKLMGIKKRDFDAVKDTTSDTQLYKQAGNGISVNVLKDIFWRLRKSFRTNIKK